MRRGFKQPSAVHASTTATDETNVGTTIGPSLASLAYGCTWWEGVGLYWAVTTEPKTATDVFFPLAFKKPRNHRPCAGMGGICSGLQLSLKGRAVVVNPQIYPYTPISLFCLWVVSCLVFLSFLVWNLVLPLALILFLFVSCLFSFDTLHLIHP